MGFEPTTTSLGSGFATNTPHHTRTQQRRLATFSYLC